MNCVCVRVCVGVREGKGKYSRALRKCPYSKEVLIEVGGGGGGGGGGEGGGGGGEGRNKIFQYYCLYGLLVPIRKFTYWLAIQITTPPEIKTTTKTRKYYQAIFKLMYL